MSHAVDEAYDVYHEVHPIARKEHTCNACKETIKPGDRYTSCHCVWDGSAETIKRCVRCQAIHVHLRDLGEGAMWPDEKLACGEEYAEHWGNPPPEEIAALAFWRPGDPMPLLPLKRKPKAATYVPLDYDGNSLVIGRTDFAEVCEGKDARSGRLKLEFQQKSYVSNAK